jgi:endo-1,4-beta-mannosidase
VPLLLIALIAGSTLTTIGIHIVAAAQSPMVVGINYMSAGNRYDDSDAQLQTDFSRFANDGIKHISIRLMWSVLMPTSSGISTSALNNIKRVLNAADNNGIKVNLDFWTQFGYTLGFPTSWAGTDYYSLLTNPTQNYWLNYVSNIVNELKGYPALESWAILNEPYYDPNTHAEQKSQFQTLMANCVQAIKSVDNTHLVICRFALSYTPGSGKYDDSVYNLFDAFAVTIYIDPSNPSDTKGNGRWSYWENTVADCKARGIPLWVIEFGDDDASAEHNRLHYELSLAKFQADGAVRAYAWAWQTRSASSEPYNIYDGTNPMPAYYELTKYGS